MSIEIIGLRFTHRKSINPSLYGPFFNYFGGGILRYYLQSMSMIEQELISFIKEDEDMVNEGIGSINESNVDFQGMTIKDIVKKYNCIPMKEVFDGLRKKLNRK